MDSRLRGHKLRKCKLVPAKAGSRNPVISHKYNLPPIIENLRFIYLTNPSFYSINKVSCR